MSPLNPKIHRQLIDPQTTLHKIINYVALRSVFDAGVGVPNA